MNKKNKDYGEIDLSRIDKKYLNVVKKVININKRISISECLENIYHFIDAFPNLSDEDYFRLSRYNYEEDWFCYLYNGLGADIKKALDYCSSHSEDTQDKYLHYLIFNKYLGNNIKDKKYLFVDLKCIDTLYNESYKKMLKKIETVENLCVKIS